MTSSTIRSKSVVHVSIHSSNYTQRSSRKRNFKKRSSKIKHRKTQDYVKMEKANSADQLGATIDHHKSRINKKRFLFLFIVGTILILAALIAIIIVLLNKPSQTASTIAADACSSFTTKFNWDYGGNDIASYTGETLLGCCARCLNTQNCTAFTFNQSRKCYVKYSIGSGGSNVANSTVGLRH